MCYDWSTTVTTTGTYTEENILKIRQEVVDGFESLSGNLYEHLGKIIPKKTIEASVERINARFKDMENYVGKENTYEQMLPVLMKYRKILMLVAVILWEDACTAISALRDLDQSYYDSL